MNHDAAHSIDDIDLAAALAGSMQLNGELANITVDVSDGVVTLEGEVDTPQKREAAELVARRFHLTAVINAITVREADDGMSRGSDGHLQASE